MGRKRKDFKLADLEPHAAKGPRVMCGECRYFSPNWCAVGVRHVTAHTPMCNYGRAARNWGAK